jgi:hypothetical protein
MTTTHTATHPELADQGTLRRWPSGAPGASGDHGATGSILDQFVSRSPVNSSAVRARGPLMRPVVEATKLDRFVVRSVAVARSRQCVTSTASG